MTTPKARRSLARLPLPVLSLLGFAALWQIGGMLQLSPALPSFDKVARALVEIMQDRRFQEAVESTAISVVLTFFPAIAIGLVLGLAMGSNRWVDWILTPYLNLSLSLPLVSLIPIFLLIFGLGRASIIAVIVAYSLPAVIVNTFAGVRSVDADQLAMARSLGASRLLTYRRIVLPSASQLILAGVRVAAGRAIKGSVIAEQVIGLVGLGGLIQRLGGAFAVEELYAVVLFIGLVGVLVVWALGKLERGQVVVR
ncbi:MAG: ABC transporter permease [Nocardioidaceae bacterium]